MNTLNTLSCSGSQRIIMETIEVKSVAWKTFLLLIAALGFVVFGAFMAYEGFKSDPKELFSIIFGLISIGFFGAAIPIGIKRLFKEVVELAITKSHLIIHPNSHKGFQLRWDQISGFQEINISGAKIILIQVTNPNEWIENESNPIKKKLMQFNFKSYGTPFNTTTSGMNISNKKLMAYLEEYHASSN